MSNPSKDQEIKSLVIAGKYDGRAEETARNLFLEIQESDKYYNSGLEVKYKDIPIQEVMNITAAGDNGKGKNSRLTYRQLQAEAEDGTLRSDKSKASGALQNLKGVFAEAEALSAFRRDYRFGLAIFEPAKQTKKVGKLLPPSIASAALKTFGAFTPDILGYAQPGKIKVGGVSITIYPALANVVDKNANQTTTIEYNSSLVTVVEVTTSSDFGQMMKKADKFSKYLSFSGNSKVKYVPVLYMDAQNFAKLTLEKRAKLVGAMKKVNGYVMLNLGLAKNAEIAANLVATELENRVKSKLITNKFDLHKPSQSNKSNLSVIQDSISFDEKKAQLNFNSSDQIKGSNSVLAQQSVHEESIATQRYQAISAILTNAGLHEGSSDWNKAIVQTAIGTGLEIVSIKDIAKQIPGIRPNDAEQLVEGAVKSTQYVLS